MHSIYAAYNLQVVVFKGTSFIEDGGKTTTSCSCMLNWHPRFSVSKRKAALPHSTNTQHNTIQGTETSVTFQVNLRLGIGT